MFLMQPLRRGSAFIVPAYYEPNGLRFAGATLPARANYLLYQQSDPIRSAEADFLSDAAIALYQSGGNADPGDVSSEFTSMLQAIRDKATVDYLGTYRLNYIVRTPGARAALAKMLTDHDPAYSVYDPGFSIYADGVLIIEWRIDGAGIYAP